MVTTFIDGNQIYTIRGENNVYFGNTSRGAYCYNPFVFCLSETTFHIPSYAINDGVNYTVYETIANSFCGTKVEFVFVPPTIEIIGPYTFVDCKTLKEVIFEEGSKLREIKTCAFSGTFLEKIVIPPSVNSLDQNAFIRYKNLTKIFYCGVNIFKKLSITPADGYAKNKINVYVVYGLYRSKYFGSEKVIFSSECLTNSSIKGHRITCKCRMTQDNRFTLILVSLST